MDQKKLEYKDKVKLDRIILILEDVLIKPKYLTSKNLHEIISELCFYFFGKSVKEQWTSTRKSAVVEFNVLLNFWNSFKNSLIMQRKINDIPVDYNTYYFNTVDGIDFHTIPDLHSYISDIDLSKERINYNYDFLRAFTEITYGQKIELFQFCPNKNCRRVFVRTKSNKIYCQPKCKNQAKEHRFTRDPSKRDKYERKKARQRLNRKRKKSQ